MNDAQRLQEFIAIVDDMPGDATQMVAPHIDIELLRPVAERRAAAVMNVLLRADAVSMSEMHRAFTAAMMDGFALGCGWAKLKQGSGEKR